MGSHRVGHDWSDLAAAEAAEMFFGSRFFFNTVVKFSWGFSGGSVVKSLPANAGDWGDLGSISKLGRFAGEEMATHSSNLAWKILWTEKTGRLQSMGLQELDTTWQLNNKNSQDVKWSILTILKDTIQYYSHLPCCLIITDIFFPEDFDHPKGNPASIKESLPISLLLPPRTNCFLFGDLPILDVLCPSNQTICEYVVFCIWLLSLSMMFSKSIHVVAHKSNSLLLWLSSIPEYGYNTFCSWFIGDEHLGCFHLFLSLIMLLYMGYLFIYLFIYMG